MDTHTIGEPTNNIRYQSKKMSEEEAAYSDSLLDRIVNMKQHIATLKQRINDERMMLEREKSEIYGSYNGEDKNQVSSFNQSPALSRYDNPTTNQDFLRVPEERLRHIHQKCDVELMNPNKYVGSIRDCKEQWKNVKFTNVTEHRSDNGDDTEEDVGPYVMSSGDRS